mmetsp:Transcript_3421/g.13958  ORF Transcript_3421/g.13958 Transcript_3421/m.13958 type:complete len:327 (-) Transcript_3421:1321-2301(-)
MVKHVQGPRCVHGRIHAPDGFRHHPACAVFRGSDLAKHPTPISAVHLLHLDRRPLFHLLLAGAVVSHARAVIAVNHAKLLEVKIRSLVHLVPDIGINTVVLEGPIRLGVSDNLFAKHNFNRESLEVLLHIREVLERSHEHVAVKGEQIHKCHCVRRVRNLALLVQALNAENLACGHNLLSTYRHTFAHHEHLVTPVARHQYLLLRGVGRLLHVHRELDDERLWALAEEVNLGDPGVHPNRNLRPECGRHLLQQGSVCVHMRGRQAVLEILAQSHAQVMVPPALLEKSVELAHELVKVVLLRILGRNHVRHGADDVTVHERSDQHGK